MKKRTHQVDNIEKWGCALGALVVVEKKGAEGEALNRWTIENPPITTNPLMKGVITRSGVLARR